MLEQMHFQAQQFCVLLCTALRQFLGFCPERVVALRRIRQFRVGLLKRLMHLQQRVFTQAGNLRVLNTSLQLWQMINPAIALIAPHSPRFAAAAGAVDICDIGCHGVFRVDDTPRFLCRRGGTHIVHDLINVVVQGQVQSALVAQ
ncbi:hypothetical protein D3C81_1208490 [compost metagenome]